MAKGDKDGAIQHADFAKRLTDAANSNPAVPPLNSGRLTYISGEFKKRGIDVPVETVRKWFMGETRPRQNRMSTLAAILRVDEYSLLTDDASRYTSDVDASVTQGVLQRFAALMLEMEGAHIAFPREGDAAAQSNKTDMYAIINGKMTSITVVESTKSGDDFVFRVPVESRLNTVVGVARIAPFTFDIVMLDWNKVKVPDEGYVETKVADLCWIKVPSVAALA